MGIALDTEFEYDFPEREKKKHPLLKAGNGNAPKGFSGKDEIIKVEARDCNIPPDSLFRHGLLQFSDYQIGYEPVILEPCNIKTASDEIGYRIAEIYMLNLLITSDGNLRIPCELHPLKKLFEDSAGYITGLTGKLQENWVMTLAFGRTVQFLPDTATNNFPHCDYMYSAARDGQNAKLPSGGPPPQISVLTSSYVGTKFYPTLAFTDIAYFNEYNRAVLHHEPELYALAKEVPVIQAPANHYSLFSDLHVRAAPVLKLEDVPLEDQFTWTEYNVEGAKRPIRSGIATIRDVFHLNCERR